MSEINTINEYLVDISNISLTIIGICLAVFTLLYSFIQNYRDKLSLNNEEIRRGNKNISLRKQVSFYRTILRTFKRANQHVIIILIINTIQFISSKLAYYTIDGISLKKNISYFLIVICIAQILYTLILLVFVLKTYYKTTRT